MAAKASWRRNYVTVTLCITSVGRGEEIESLQDVVELLWICCTTSCTTNRQQNEVMRFERSNLGQVVCSHLSLSPSSIIWYRSRSGDAMRLGR